MQEASTEAGRRSVGTARNQGSKPRGSARRGGVKTTRVQLHLGSETARRLAVHCALVARSSSLVADKILLSWLKKDGKGGQIFDQANGIDVADTEDRAAGGLRISSDSEDKDA